MARRRSEGGACPVVPPTTTPARVHRGAQQSEFFSSLPAAIRAGDEEEAVRLVTEHAERAGELLANLLEHGE